MVIDSRCGEDFSAFSPGGGGSGGSAGGPALAPRFDACASWWTQVRGLHTDDVIHNKDCRCEMCWLLTTLSQGACDILLIWWAGHLQHGF